MKLLEGFGFRILTPTLRTQENTKEEKKNQLGGQIKTQIDLMSDQLGKKDDQITQLNEVTQKQAVHIQSLIQENSKLNMKLLPETTENKPWWKFWR